MKLFKSKEGHVCSLTDIPKVEDWYLRNYVPELVVFTSKIGQGYLSVLSRHLQYVTQKS